MHVNMRSSIRALPAPATAYVPTRPPSRSLRLAPRAVFHPRIARTRSLTSSAAVATPDVADSLNGWVSQSLSQDLGVQCAVKDGELVAVARRDFGAGEEILNVPQKTWITPATASASELGDSVAQLEPWLQVALLLIKERSKLESGEGSAFESYISSLPTELGSPVFWPESDLQGIEGTQLWQSCLGYRDFFAQKFKDLQATVFASNPTIFDPSVFTFEAFCWGVGTVRARVHPPLDGNDVAMVPMADLVVHSRLANVTWELSSGNLLRRESSLVLKTTKEIGQGQTLQMDFGPNALDGKIALDYGVVDEFVPTGGYSLTMKIPENDSCLDDKLDILELQGMGESVTFELVADVPPAPEFLGFLRLLNCSGDDAFHLEALFRNDAWDHMMEPLSQTNEEMLCETMIGGCKEALRGYESIPKRSKGAGKREELSWQVCDGERAGLEYVLQWFEDRKSKVESLEFYAERRLRMLNLLDDEGNSTFEDMFT
ncbi:hypothetical protein BSKO_01966 [Bryopsis sp. KO-2023]|nr:hypothetical protein BSKO_01966 [Bryopsis sp. KO-2023]